MSKKILLVFGTRPEVIKLAPLILALKDSKLKNDFIVASTSQHDELLDKQLDFWQINPDYFLTSCPSKKNLVRLLSYTLSGLQDIIDSLETIEYIIVQGDTNTSLACSNLAFLNQLKLIHIEAGLRSFDFENPFPEEFNRTVTSRAAYFHFAPTELSKKNLINEGVDISKIMVVGNTVVDALNHANKNKKEDLLKERRSILITLHRRENTDINYQILIDIIAQLADEHPGLKFIWVAHPNCIEKISSKLRSSKNIEIHNHLPYDKFVGLYDTAKLVITDSGGVTEESIQLGLPLVVFRLKTERLEAIKINYPMIISLKKMEIVSFFNSTINQTNDKKYSYGNGNASDMIVNWLCKEIKPNAYETVIIGGGPAGTGLLLKHLKDDGAKGIANKRVALIERSSHLVKGNITSYKVNSDTFSDVFLECLEGATSESIDIEELKDEIEYIKSFKGKAIPLNELDTYFIKLGNLLKTRLEADNSCMFYMNSSVTKVVQKEDGYYQVFFAEQHKQITTKELIIATGGNPTIINGNTNLFGEKISLEKHSEKLVHSDDLLKLGVPARIKSELHKKKKAVILGGSHSAFSAAHFLLNSKENFGFCAGDINIWCNTKPKIYFPSEEDAIESGYRDFAHADFCPVTKKLYRLAGLRMDGRELYMKMIGIGKSSIEDRVTLKIYSGQLTELEKDLKEATLIICAFGYKLNMFPFFDDKNNPILFKGEQDGHWVNENCEMLNNLGLIIPDLYATGLATGFIPTGKLGGEPSFKGQTNGIWYYQNAIAELIQNRLKNENSANMS